MRLLIDHLLTLAGFLLALALMVRVVGDKRQPGGTMAWVLAILFVPYIGVPLYLLIGGRKIQRQIRKKAPLFDVTEEAAHHAEDMMIGGPDMVRAGMPAPRSGNAVELHFNGETAYQELIRLFKQARESIHVTTFILGRDEVGQAIVEVLADRARHGVQVRLLLDGLGCFRSSSAFVQPLRDAGGEVAEFLPVLPLRRKWSANLRNHRKIAVIDHRAAMVGGMNLATNFMGPEPSAQRFVDAATFVEGPIVANIETVFANDWRYTTDQYVSVPEYNGIAEGIYVKADPVSTLQLVASGPDVPEDTFNDTLLSAIMDARERIWLVTPYFVPDESFVKTLAIKARMGRDVRILLPLISNHHLADLARGPAIREIIAAGGRIYLYPKGMVHAKIMLFDHNLAITGTPNLDMRSLYLNFEVALFHYTRPEIERVAAWIGWMQGQSVLFSPDPVSRPKAWAENLCQLISPLL